jgi:hypothetical protein
MRVLKKEKCENGNIILTCEDSIFFGLIKKEIQFIATEEFPKGYWNWRMLPDRLLICDSISFQLDSWCRDFLKEEKNK